MGLALGGYGCDRRAPERSGMPRPEAAIGIERHDRDHLEHAVRHERQGPERRADGLFGPGFDQETRAGNIPAIPDLADESLRIERTCALGLRLQAVGEIGLAELLRPAP
jgi:hypothetical protein